MKKFFKKLTSAVLTCGILFNISASAINPEILSNFNAAFKGRVILDEDFTNPVKFPMWDAELILKNMTDLFSRNPNVADKLISDRKLVIKPFEMSGKVYPDAPADSFEILSGIFKYKIERNIAFLFIDAIDTRIAMIGIPDALILYNQLLTAELISLVIHAIIYDRHVSEFSMPITTPLPNKYFDEIKNEIIALARTRYGYIGDGKVLCGKESIFGGQEIIDLTKNSKDWLLAMFSCAFKDDTVCDTKLRAATNDWLQRI